MHLLVLNKMAKKNTNDKVKKKGFLIIEGHDKNPFVKFWNWGWGIYYDNPEFWNYVLVGLFTTIVCIVAKFASLKTFLDQTNPLELQIAEVLSWAIAVIVAFILNKIIVFKTKTNTFKALFHEVTTFVGGRVGTQLIQMGIMFVFVSWMKLDTDMWVLFFTIVCQVMQVLLNYFISKFITFKKKD